MVVVTNCAMSRLLLVVPAHLFVSLSGAGGGGDIWVKLINLQTRVDRNLNSLPWVVNHGKGLLPVASGRFARTGVYELIRFNERAVAQDVSFGRRMAILQYIGKAIIIHVPVL